MGNNASSNHHSSQSRKRIPHATAAASLSSFGTHLHSSHPKQSSSASRRRKSLEFPDLEPSLKPARLSGLPAPHALDQTPSSTFQDLAQFQLRLPERGRNSPALQSTTSSSSNCAGPLTAIEAMRLDSGDDFKPNPPLAPLLSFSHAPATVDPGEPPEEEPDAHASQTLIGSPPCIGPNPNTLPITCHAPMPPPLSGSSPLSLPPLQQPVETVVPPLPPAIQQPFPPALPDSNSSVPQALTTAVTETVAAATAVVQAAPALDIGAGSQGVPTLITWKEPAHEVYVTGTFSKWKQQIKLQKPLNNNTSGAGQENNFSALVALPPGPHRLKFIVDRRWKTSKYLPSATDDKGNLINYLHVNPGDQPFRGLGPRGIWSGYMHTNWASLGSLYDEKADTAAEEDCWTSEIPEALIAYEDYHETTEVVEDQAPGQAGFAAEPPKLPAQLKEGILNLASRSPEGTSDDNSLLPKPDHSVLNHLAASPIKQGLLSVGVTSRYKRKYLTTVYYKPVDL